VSQSLDSSDAYYNLLVRGFQHGQLNLKREVPLRLAQSANPYDPDVSSPYPVLDMSYYKGRLYLYYGVTPALLLFWPYAAVTGKYLLQKDAVVIFCLVGFLISVGLLYALWRRYFAEVSIWVVAAGVLALGLSTCVPPLLARCDVYEVPISCGYAFTMLAVAGIWKALHHSSSRAWWLAMASLAYGLAVGARPLLLFGAVVLLLPVVHAWRENRRVWVLLIATIGPIVLIGLGLMIYNTLRFDNPFEFGLRYALSGDRQAQVSPFSLRYLWFHLKVYFLGGAGWSIRFPFVHDIAVSAMPVGHGRVEHTFGVLTNMPIVWLALAVPLAWGCRSEWERSTLCRFVLALAIIFWISTLTLSLFFSASIRYEAEFLPVLVLLAMIGMLSLERVLASQHASSRRAMRYGGSLLLGFSVAFNLFASLERCAESDCYWGIALQKAGRDQEAISKLNQALRIKPNFAEAHSHIGAIFLRHGKVSDAILHFEAALQINPNRVEAHNNLGVALQIAGHTQEAISHLEQAIHIKPDFVEAHLSLANVLAEVGNMNEAISQWEQAIHITPDRADAHNDLGTALVHIGKVKRAIAEYEEAIRLQPNFIEAQANLARLKVVQ